MANHFFSSSFSVGLSLGIAVSPFLAMAQKSHEASPISDVDRSGLLNVQESCFVVQDKSDKEGLIKLDQELMALNAELGSNPEVLESQARKLIEKSISEMAPQTRVALNAQLLMQKTAATLAQIQSDPSLSKELLDFQMALDENSKSSQKLAASGKFSTADMIPDVSFQAYRMLKLHSAQKESAKSGDKISQAHESLFQSIQNSKSLSDEQKKLFRGNVTKITQEALASSNRATDHFTDNVEIRKNVAGAVRDTSVGAGLTIGGLMLLGGTSSSATGAVALNGLGRLGGIGLTILKGAAGGGSFAGGFRIGTGGMANILRATFDQGDFFCNLAQEQKDNSALLYAEATSAAKTGAVFGGIFAGGALVQAGLSKVMAPYGRNGALAVEEFMMLPKAAAQVFGTTELVLSPVINESLRDDKTAKKLSEVIAAKDPIEKIRIFEEAVYNGLGPNSRNSAFNQYIKPALEGTSDRKLSVQQSNEINEILDTIIVGYALQNALESRNYGRSNLVGIASAVPATMPYFYESSRLKSAGKRIRQILDQ